MKKLAQTDKVVKPEPLKAKERREGSMKKLAQTDRVVKPEPLKAGERRRGLDGEVGSDRQSR